MTTESTNYQQVTVDVPVERVAEFHAFFARFLAGRSGRGRRGRHGHPGHHMRGRHCGHRGAAEHGTTGQESEQGAATGQPTEITEV